MLLLKMSFKRVLERNNGFCPHCDKSIPEDCDRKTLVKHADGACCSDARNDELLDDIEVATRRTIESVNDDNINEVESVEDDMEQGDVMPGSDRSSELWEENEASWEQDFRDIEAPIQRNGSRQTGAQVRDNFGKNIGARGETLAKSIYHLLEKDRPAHVIEDMLSFGQRTCSKPSLIPNSFHVIRRALEMRSLASVDIHICSSCYQFAWKPQPKKAWPLCPEDCECSGCTCPVCLQNGIKDSKRFKTDISGYLEPRMVRAHMQELWSNT
jgi:hypothetical protein